MTDREKQEPSKDQDSPVSEVQRSEGGGRQRKGRRKHTVANRPLDESVNMDELREIVELISEHGFTDFELENKDVRVRLRRELAPQIVSMPATESHVADVHALSEASTAMSQAPLSSHSGVASSKASGGADVGAVSDEDEDLHKITSPIVGSFFRAPSPNTEPFVGLGSTVSPDTVVCIIEAMKLMNEIQADTTGVVAKIYVENGQPVEFGQPLFGIKK